jgi:phosphatidylinositol alpha 1,6-mannosyltransferase
MRVAIVSESFLPTVNGVTNSVCKVLDHLAAAGHQAIVITPTPGIGIERPVSYRGFPVHHMPAIAYRQFPVGLPHPQVQRLLAGFAPDVIHAASPFLLGAHALAAAARLGIPSVAIFQTDVAGYAKRNHLGPATALAWKFVRRIHNGAGLTLVPSSASERDLVDAGVRRLARWGRGVDTVRYHPNNRHHRDSMALRRLLAPNGEIIVGYVGRIAPEKQVERLAELRGLRNIRIVIVGDGPAKNAVKSKLAGLPVTWLGRLGGQELAMAYASFDIFVHTGTEETFGQTIQEAHAAGLPVVAPLAGGPIDLVADGTTGFLFDPDVRGEFAALTSDLVASETLRFRMGEQGRRAVLGKTWQRVCGELVEHYQTVIASAVTGGTGAHRPANDNREWVEVREA